MADVETHKTQTDELTLETALKYCLKVSRNHNQLATGSMEVVKGLIRESGGEKPFELVVMANDLVEGYKVIIMSRCIDLGIPVVNIESRKELANIAPFKKAKSVGVLGIRDFVVHKREKSFILNFK